MEVKLFLIPVSALLFPEAIENVLVSRRKCVILIFNCLLIFWKLLFQFIFCDCSAPNGEEILNESEVKLDAVRRKIKQVAQELIGEDVYQFHRAISPGILF